jgi:trehalose 6-phosphate phosphatase
VHYFFSRTGLKAVVPFLGGDTLLAFDFDGTLAPIVADPNRAALPRGTTLLLRGLSRLWPVALISGRRASDLKSRSRFRLVAWVGNHGMEGIPGREESSRQAARQVSGWKRTLENALAEFPDLVVEDKKYSLTIHYRASGRRASRKRFLLSLAASLRPAPRILPGKCVLNLLVPGHPHKGDALRALLKEGRFRRAIFVGDDDTDEDVFRLRDPRIHSIRIGRRKSSLANAYLRNQAEMERLLQFLLESRRD